MIKGNNTIITKQTAGLLVLRQRKSGCQILLVHDRKKWSIPKGGMELGETPEQTARREVWEETGITFGSDVIPVGYVDYKKEQKRLHAFVAELEDEVDIVLSGELIQARFVSFAEARRMLDERQCIFLDWLTAGSRAA